MAAALDERDRKRWAEMGMGAMSPAEGIEALQALLGSTSTQAAVLPMDWRRHRDQAGAGGPTPFLSLMGGDRIEPTGPAGSPAPVRLLAELEGAAPRKRLTLLANHVRDQTLKVLGLPSTFALDSERGLRDVGLDSLLALELRNRLQATIGHPLPATLAFDCPTVGALSRYLAADVLSLELTAPDAEPTVDRTGQAAIDEVDNLSDEMAEALLARELAGARMDAGKRN